MLIWSYFIIIFSDGQVDILEVPDNYEEPVTILITVHKSVNKDDFVNENMTRNDELRDYLLQQGGDLVRRKFVDYTKYL